MVNFFFANKYSVMLYYITLYFAICGWVAKSRNVRTKPLLKATSQIRMFLSTVRVLQGHKLGLYKHSLVALWCNLPVDRSKYDWKGMVFSQGA